VLNEGLALLTASQRLTEKVKALESGWEPRLTIAVDSVMPCEPVFDLIGEFCALQKPVNIEVIEEVLGGGWDALHTQRADIAVGVSGDVSSGQYDIVNIGSLAFVFAVAPDHPLATLPDPINSKQVADYPAIVVKDSSRSLPERSSGLFAAKQTIHVTSVNHKIKAQLQGIGVGFLPVHLIGEHVNQGRLVIKNTDIPRPAMPLFVAKHKSTQGKAANWFFECCKKLQLNPI
jgi:DNA-binding transcriptional LysR family regulator